MVDPTAIGSPADVGTFLLVLYTVRNEIRPRLNRLSAAVVALANSEPTVDEDRLQDDLDVDETEVDAVRRRMVCGGHRVPSEEDRDD